MCLGGWGGWASLSPRTALQVCGYSCLYVYVSSHTSLTCTTPSLSSYGGEECTVVVRNSDGTFASDYYAFYVTSLLRLSPSRSSSPLYTMATRASRSRRTVARRRRGGGRARRRMSQ